MKKLLFFFSLLSLIFFSCDEGEYTTVSESGIDQASVEVSVNSNGYTVEQQNIIDRYNRDDDPGAIKHLYVISAYSGDVLVYSTVKGKVTSSGKRLSPLTVADNDATGVWDGIPITIAGRKYYTSEVLQDDGTYGNSIDYLYWFDSKGIFHKHYVSGGQIIHIASQPMVVPKVILNLDSSSS